MTQHDRQLQLAVNKLTSTVMADKVESPHTQRRSHARCYHAKCAIQMTRINTIRELFIISLIAVKAGMSLYNVVTPIKESTGQGDATHEKGLQREGGGGGQNAQYWFIPLLLGDGVLNLNTFPVKFHLTWSKIKKTMGVQNTLWLHAVYKLGYNRPVRGLC